MENFILVTYDYDFVRKNAIINIIIYYEDMIFDHNRLRYANTLNVF